MNYRVRKEENTSISIYVDSSILFLQIIYITLKYKEVQNMNSYPLFVVVTVILIRVDSLPTQLLRLCLADTLSDH